MPVIVETCVDQSKDLKLISLYDFLSEKGKLADPFYRLEHQEEDMQKKKEAEPVLVRLQRFSDVRHSDDYTLNKALRSCLRNQKKRVAEEETVCRSMGLGLRLLPKSEEDSAAAKRVKFSSRFEKNKKEKRAVITGTSIFPEQSSSSAAAKKRLELESKRRQIKAIAASNLLTAGIKPSSWSQPSVSTVGTKRIPVTARIR
ncbi:coiled-coil protein [Thalictrum thalictroides]|uniref:Coiled-coil protein n=1 Tax=Thalictrum thalictroides TaxID=46969 RepID=A0A7J6X3J0_THATH|nr:coiled-coil protein [Thalictrum thalictroides]